MVFLLLSPAKEQYFIPGRRMGVPEASPGGVVAVGGQGQQAEGAREALPWVPQPALPPHPCRHGGLPAEQRVQQRRRLSAQVPL